MTGLEIGKKNLVEILVFGDDIHDFVSFSRKSYVLLVKFATVLSQCRALNLGISSTFHLLAASG